MVKHQGIFQTFDWGKAVREQAQDAVRAYATQIAPYSLYWFALPPGIARTTYPYDDYILAQGSVPEKPPEDGLSAGIVGDHVRPAEAF